MAFLECVVHVRNGLSPVPMELCWGSLKLPPGFLQVMDGRVNPRMMLRRRTSRGCAGRRRRGARPRRSRLCVKSNR